MNKIKLGGHLRATEGLRFIPVEARALNYNIVQTQLCESREWDPITVSDDTAAEYRKMMYGIETYVHLPFVINPCESRDRTRNFYRHVVRNHAKVARNLLAGALVLHPGSRKESSEEEAKKNLIKFLEDLLDKETKLTVLLEVDAGSREGTRVGSPAFIKGILSDLSTGNLGMCVDTTHLYARGVDLWEKEILERFLDDYGSVIKLVHLNVPDPEVELGSNLDRHNSPFESFTKDSDHLVRSVVKEYPCILERRSIGIQKKDLEFIQTLMGTPQPEENLNPPTVN